jgi:hypothetical protein
MHLQKNTTVRLEDDLVARFRELVFRKHGTLYGALRTEFNRAVEGHIRQLEKELEIVKECPPGSL